MLGLELDWCETSKEGDVSWGRYWVTVREAKECDCVEYYGQQIDTFLDMIVCKVTGYLGSVRSRTVIMGGMRMSFRALLDIARSLEYYNITFVKKPERSL